MKIINDGKHFLKFKIDESYIGCEIDCQAAEDGPCRLEGDSSCLFEQDLNYVGIDILNCPEGQGVFEVTRYPVPVKHVSNGSLDDYTSFIVPLTEEELST